jgi:hypothetical protein
MLKLNKEERSETKKIKKAMKKAKTVLILLLT